MDALVALPPERVPGFVAALGQEGFSVDGRDFADAMVDGSHVTVFDQQSPFHVDVKLATTAPEMEELKDSVEITFSDGAVAVPQPEEVVAFKLSYGSPQDLQDARSILARQAERLDRARLRALARRLDVEDALDEALRDADGPA